MAIFKDYAYYYDALYAEKNYEAECSFIETLWREYSDLNVGKILDLGCGTGGHGLILAARRYFVTGIDISDSMIAQAKKKVQKNDLQIQFEISDIRNFELGEKFDVVIAMFDVMSYLTSDDDFLKTLACVKAHLKSQGLFIFDVWFGPGVITDLPVKREKRIKIDGNMIKRIAEPEIDLMKQTVHVHYALFENNNLMIEETHPMRFFFPREISLLVRHSGMRLQKLLAAHHINRSPAISTWKATCIVGE